jgi:hypothetical protein
MKSVPEINMEILGQYKPLLERILYSFEDVREFIKELNGDGSTLKGSSIEATILSTSPLANPVEKQIITIIEANEVIKSIEQSLYGLRSDNFDIYVKRFEDKLTHEQIMEQLDPPLSIPTIKRRIDLIYQFIILGLETDEISFYTIYWFCDKYCPKIFRTKVC